MSDVYVYYLQMDMKFH